MAIRSYTRSFNGGEVAPAMFARIDDAKYQTGLAKCKNFLIEPQGPLVSRPGFEYVRETKYANKKTKLIPFNFSDTQTMVLEFGDKYIRFHTNGATLLKDDGSVYEISTPYGEDDLFDIHYVQSADILTLVHPSYAPRELRRYSALDWRLVEISFGSNLAAPTGVTATQSINKDVSNKEDYVREYSVTSLLSDGSQESVRSDSVSLKCNPYGDGAFNTITWEAVSGAGLYRIYRNQGGIWCYIGQTSDTKIVDENIDPDASITPPLYEEVFSRENGIASVEVTHPGEGYYGIGDVIGYKKQGALYGEDGAVISSVSLPFTVSTDLGMHFEAEIVDNGGFGSGASATVLWESAGSNLIKVTGFTIDKGGKGYINPEIRLIRVKHAVNPVVKTKVASFKAESNSLEGIKLVVSDPTGSGAELKPEIIDGKITGVKVISGGANYTSPTIYVMSEKGSGAQFSSTLSKVGDYPGAVSYFEQRRWFGGTYNRPNNLWATKSGTESVMSYSLPTQDTDRIAVRVAARESSRIQHIVPLAHLMLLTGSAEWRVSPLNDDAITPSSMSVRPQSYVGASNVQPLVVNNTMIYVASRGGHLRECGYNYQAGGFVSNDICLRAPHLFDNLDVVDMAFAKAPWPIAWAVSTNGSLIALTYVPEQQVGAFSTVETKGAFKACCVVAESDEDILYCVVERTINGVTKQFVERMHERQFKSLDDSNYMDCSAVYKGEAKAEIGGRAYAQRIA